MYAQRFRPYGARKIIFAAWPINISPLWGESTLCDPALLMKARFGSRLPLLNVRHTSVSHSFCHSLLTIILGWGQVASKPGSRRTEVCRTFDLKPRDYSLAPPVLVPLADPKAAITKHTPATARITGTTTRPPLYAKNAITKFAMAARPYKSHFGIIRLLSVHALPPSLGFAKFV